MCTHKKPPKISQNADVVAVNYNKGQSLTKKGKKMITIIKIVSMDNLCKLHVAAYAHSLRMLITF